jgi:hypothetical protein
MSAKGMNLALHDAEAFANAVIRHQTDHDPSLLDSTSVSTLTVVYSQPRMRSSGRTRDAAGNGWGGMVARSARATTALLALLILTVLALTPASEATPELVSASGGVSSEPLEGGAPHDCHREPLHGTHYVAGQASDRARPGSADRHVRLGFHGTDSCSWRTGSTDLAVLRASGQAGHDLQVWRSPPSLQVFRL